MIRLVAGIAAIVHGIIRLRGVPALESALLPLLCMVPGSFLIIGLWTPVVGALLALAAFWTAFAYPEHRWYCILIGTLGAALALLGPGMWSVDARLFGWKRLKIGDRK